MNAQKSCFKCGEVKSLSGFYKHPMMADGHVNKCKECNKKDVIQNRIKNVDYYREYDRERGNRQHKDYISKYRETFPQKHKAHVAVHYARKSGKLHHEPCQNCGENNKNHAHHDDYMKVLNIKWLCPACHKAWHDKNGEGKNGS